MISTGMVVQSKTSLSSPSTITAFEEIDIKNMAASTNMLIKNTEATSDTPAESPSGDLIALEMETAPASIIIPPRIEVYEAMTIEELATKLNRNLGTGYLAGKGLVVANRCIELGVDPYIATAIMLHETGCKYNCSALVRNCNNVGGQKGTPSCSGAYKGYNTLDEGIIGFVDNLYKNYYAKGLTTVETIAPRYAESGAWPAKINNYVNSIRAN